MGIHSKLLNIQRDLKVPKGQLNTFGNYHYRSCEDILEALKPLLTANETTLIITDTIDSTGSRFYVRATATLTDVETNESISVVASAREEETKKGQDASQITGSTSSYARKYCLNGLFAIDDAKDSDSTNTHGKEQEPTKEQSNQQKPNQQKQTQQKPKEQANVTDIADVQKATILTRIGQDGAGMTDEQKKAIFSQNFPGKTIQALTLDELALLHVKIQEAKAQ